jgi:hypothetical protein
MRQIVAAEMKSRIVNMSTVFRFDSAAMAFCGM